LAGRRRGRPGTRPAGDEVWRGRVVRPSQKQARQNLDRNSENLDLFLEKPGLFFENPWRFSRDGGRFSMVDVFLTSFEFS
jgi:hypothetical protein